jgi:hypothetical protein
VCRVCLRRANSVGSVQHAKAENEAFTGPAGLVLPFLPHKRVGCVAFASLGRHDGTHHDRDEAASKNKKEADVGQSRQGPVGIHDDKSRNPRIQQVDDKNVPSFVGIAGVEQAVHADNLVGKDGGHGCSAEEPAPEVPPTWGSANLDRWCCLPDIGRTIQRSNQGHDHISGLQ